MARLSNPLAFGTTGGSADALARNHVLLSAGREAGPDMLRQLWPPAGCAQRLAPHDPLPHEMVERVLLSPDLSGVIFSQLCNNTLDPGVAVAFSSVSSELWALTHVQRQQLKADYNVAAALSLKLGMQGCKELREAKTVEVDSSRIGLSEDDLATVGTLASLLPALDKLDLYSIYPLRLNEQAAGHHGVQRRLRANERKARIPHKLP